MTSKNNFMLRAIELSINSANSTGGPFGCVIVKDTKLLEKVQIRLLFQMIQQLMPKLLQ